MGESRDLAERTGQANLLLNSMAYDGLMALLDGHLEQNVDINQDILARGEELGLSEFAATLAVIAFRPHLYLGKADEALRVIDTLRQPWHPGRAVCLAYLGRDAEAAELVEQFVLARPDIGSAEDETPAFWDVLSLEAAVLVGHQQAAELLLRRLAGGTAPTTGFVYSTCTGRHLGAAAAFLGRPDEARTHYQAALNVANEIRFRPEVALTRLQLAELLLEHYPKEKSEALEHLDFCIGEFRDMKMQPSLERALKHKEILGA